MSESRQHSSKPLVIGIGSFFLAIYIFCPILYVLSAVAIYGSVDRIPRGILIAYQHFYAPTDWLAIYWPRYGGLQSKERKFFQDCHLFR